MNISNEMEKVGREGYNITKELLILLLKILDPIELKRDILKDKANELFDLGWTVSDKKNAEIYGISIPASDDEKATRKLINYLKAYDIPYVNQNDGSILVPAFCPYERENLGEYINPTQEDYEAFIKEVVEDAYDVNVQMPSDDIEKILTGEVKTPDLANNFDLTSAVTFDKMSNVLTLDGYVTSDNKDIGEYILKDLADAGFEVNMNSRTIDFSKESNLAVLAGFMEKYRTGGYDSRNLTDNLNKIICDREGIPFKKLLVNENRERRTEEAELRLKINPMDKEVYEEFRSIGLDNSWEFDVTKKAEDMYMAKEVDIDEEDLEDIDEFERENNFNGAEEKEEDDMPNPEDIQLDEINEMEEEEEEEPQTNKKESDEEFRARMEEATRRAYDEEMIIREQIDDISRRQASLERDAQFRIEQRRQLEQQLENQQRLGRELETARLTRQLDDNARELQRIDLEARRAEAQMAVAQADYARNQEEYKQIVNSMNEGRVYNNGFDSATDGRSYSNGYSTAGAPTAAYSDASQYATSGSNNNFVNNTASANSGYADSYSQGYSNNGYSDSYSQSYNNNGYADNYSQPYVGSGYTDNSASAYNNSAYTNTSSYNNNSYNSSSSGSSSYTETTVNNGAYSNSSAANYRDNSATSYETTSYRENGASSYNQSNSNAYKDNSVYSNAGAFVGSGVGASSSTSQYNSSVGISSSASQYNSTAGSTAGSSASSTSAPSSASQYNSTAGSTAGSPVSSASAPNSASQYNSNVGTSSSASQYNSTAGSTAGSSASSTSAPSSASQYNSSVGTSSSASQYNSTAGSTAGSPVSSASAPNSASQYNSTAGSTAGSPVSSASAPNSASQYNSTAGNTAHSSGTAGASSASTSNAGSPASSASAPNSASQYINNKENSVSGASNKSDQNVVDKAHDNYAGSLYASEVNISKIKLEEIREQSNEIAKKGVEIIDSKYSEKEKVSANGGEEPRMYTKANGLGIPEGGDGTNWGSDLPQGKETKEIINTSVVHVNPYEGYRSNRNCAGQVLGAAVTATTAVVTNFGLSAVGAAGMDANSIRTAGKIGRDIAGSLAHACKNSAFVDNLKVNANIDAKNRLHTSIKSSLETVCNNDIKFMDAKNSLNASKQDKIKLAGGNYNIYQMNAANEKIQNNQKNLNSRRNELASVSVFEKEGVKKYIENPKAAGKKGIVDALDAIEKDVKKGKITEAEGLKLKIALNNDVAKNPNFRANYKRSVTLGAAKSVATIGIAGAGALAKGGIRVSKEIIGESEDIRTMKNALSGGRRVIKGIRKTKNFTRKGFNACAEVSRLRGNKNALSVKIVSLDEKIRKFPGNAIKGTRRAIGRLKPVREIRKKANRSINGIGKRVNTLHDKRPTRRAYVFLSKKVKNSKVGKAFSKINKGRKAVGKVAGKVVDKILSPVVLLKKALRLLKGLYYKVILVLAAIVLIALALQGILEALTGSWAAIYDAAERIANYPSVIEDERVDTPIGATSVTMEALDVVYYQAPRILRGVYGTLDKIFNDVQDVAGHFGWIGRKAANAMDHLEDEAEKAVAEIYPDENVVVFEKAKFSNDGTNTWYSNYSDFSKKNPIGGTLMVYDLFDQPDSGADTSAYKVYDLKHEIDNKYNNLGAAYNSGSHSDPYFYGNRIKDSSKAVPGNGLYYLYDTANASLDEAEAYIIYVDEKGYPCGKISNVKQILSMTSVVFEDYGVRIGETNTDVEGDPSINKDDVGLGGIFELFEFFKKVRNGASKIVCDVFEKATHINVPDWLVDSSQRVQTLSMVAYSTSAYLSSHDIYLGYAVMDDGSGNTTISLSPCQGRKDEKSMYEPHYDGSDYTDGENNMACKVITITRKTPLFWKKWTKAALAKTFYGTDSWSVKQNLPTEINACYGKTKYKYDIKIDDQRLKKLEKEQFKKDEFMIFNSFSYTASSSKAVGSSINSYRGNLAVLKQYADDNGALSTTNDTADGVEWPGVYICHSYVDYCLKWAIGTKAFDSYGNTLTFAMCPGHPQVCVYLQIFTFGADTGMGENEDTSDPDHPKSGTYNLFDKVDSNPFCKNFEVFMSKNGEFKNNWNSYKYVPGSGGTKSKYEYDKTTITNDNYKACFPSP